MALAIIIFSLQSLVYPEAIGRAVPIDAVTTAGTMADAFLTTTTVGALLLAAMLLLYVMIAKGRPSGPDQAEGKLRL